MRAPSKRRHGLFRRLLQGIGFFILLIAVSAFGLMALLREDRVTGLAKDQIARLAGDGYETNLETASLSFFKGGIAGVAMDGISIRNSTSKQPLLKNGNAFFAVSLTSLLTGKIQLTDLSLADAEMFLSPGAGQGASLTQTVLGADGLVDPALVSKALDDAAITISARLAANPDLIINAVNTKLVFGQNDTAPSIMLEKLVASKTASGDYAFDSTISNGNWTTKLTGAVGQNQSNGEAPSYRVNLDPIPFQRTFTAQAPDFKPRECTGLAGFAVASSNGLASVDANLIKANCTFGVLGDYEMVATINGRLKRGDGVFEIGRGVININRSVFNFDGAFAPARYTPKPEQPGETPRYRYELVLSPSKMDSVDNTAGALPLQGKIAGTYAPAENRLALDEVTADANGSIVRGAASLLFTGVTPALYLALTSDKIPVTDFKRIWPRFAAPSARNIVMERVTAGLISNLRLELQLPPGKIGSRTFLERQQLTGSGQLAGATFATYGNLPAVRDATGRVSFDGVEVDIQLTGGLATTPSGGQVKIKPSSFVIADTHVSPLAAELKVAISGDANLVAEVASLEPVNAFKNQDFAPADLSGQADVDGVFSLELVKKGQKAPPPKFQVNVDLNRVSLSKPVNGQKISNASGTIKASNEQTNIRLDAEIGGLPAKIIISEPSNAPEKRTQEIALTLTDALRDKLAPALNGFVSGPVSASVKGSSASAKIELDLTKAVLRIMPFNWEKGAGIGAKATFSFTKNDDTISISNLQISGRGIEGTGKLQIQNGELSFAELRNVRLNPGDNFSLGLKDGAQGLRATLGGAQFDARALMKSILPGRKPRKEAKAQSVEVSGNVGRLIGFNDEAILNAQIGFTPGKNAALSLMGDFENGGSIDLSSSGNGRLVVQTGNAGAALRFVDLYKRMVGGKLSTNLKVTGGSNFTGPISISDFTVVGEPRLAKLANEQAGGTTSLAQATQADLAGAKARFELAQGNVVLDRGTVQLQNGIVRGANVGATAEGIVLSATGQMDLRGTFMPARGLNRIVGSIPILGLLLGSGNKAGLIGITYRLAGDAKNPKVFVNPISVIAPGVFRQIFE